ncbi:FAD-binding oxidoreductase [Methylobacterium sp. E-065]|uniref:NAD(P)/FAD-dependent oxidoreductase n=1 Tax=Methylobacterium sp. E-065 TaxID=2836583 RepID=UPI001FBA0C2A|nr:FAD-binding oxidoreductase [Methylobacterium sp. E-065]MCJ2017071.1 FAD-binding oxidoreductase [Methylobacterium sp. E-065]
MIKSEPYWWQAAPLAASDPTPVRGTADVVIVGAGYTGLSAALTLARAGRSVQVFDRQKPGEGASSRNGGITSGNLRPSLAALTKQFGAERAAALVAESKAAREDLYQFIAEEGIDCDFKLVGRFAGASRAADYERLAREADHLRSAFGIEAYPVGRGEQQSYIGSTFYHGGNVRMDIGGLHPAKLHAAMLRLARDAGALVHGETAVLGIRDEAGGYEVLTARGAVRASHVIVGTNGYTDRFDRWLRSRLVPVRSRIIATVPLSANLMGELMPSRMMYSETRKLHYYYRPSPDGTRILFGGRDGTIAGDAEWPTASLRRALADIFPQLAGVTIEHSWYGNVAMNRDMVPRIFARSGRRYAAGYCGSGVVWARWAGRKAALQVLSDQAGGSALDFRPPRWVPLISGKAWFMPAVFGWLRFRDWLATRE